jgi:glycerol-3-phosphate cytidylyltransferase-like family protein
MKSKTIKYKEIYFPMTANILTVGHIKCLDWLARRGLVTVGLLTPKALKGYKKEIVPFKDRKYILDTIISCVAGARLVAQDSLNPSDNLKKYQCTHIASGDGWEKEELIAAKKLGVVTLDIKLKGENGKKKYSSTQIKNS